MKTVQISFNYDPEILEKAGVDLDSGTLALLKGLLLTDLAEHIENLRDNVRGGDMRGGNLSRHDEFLRQLALAEAFTAEG